MNNSVNSVQENLNKEKNVQDIKLVKGLLRYVLHDYYPAVNWKPGGIFLEEIDNSPCSVAIKSAMKLHLDANGGEIHSFYDEDFPRKGVINNKEHLDILRYLKSVFEIDPFDNARFLNYLCMCAEYAALSYLYGAKRAPLLTLQIISTMMKEMRESGKISQDVWSDFEKYCESYVQTERRRGYMRRPEYM
ncbi:hypothetical protein AVEN_70230-1 [Araneus ventricosus]|uniref:Uncharacterized protein n=1 Tax=Araneus ventricosus TaxID=182803 RepID=A0A4Y2GA86_ARAVE|nr:hypothetical protein AVEN_70230-1 [Araneus ventricosus]